MAPGSKDSQVNVRFDEMTDARLVAAAKKLGTTKSALVRHLTETFLTEIANTGSMELNINWKTKLEKADARTAWGEAKMPVVPEMTRVSDAPELPVSKVEIPDGETL
jgi:antitoxin component of RelBE/YafQ-DinJ toxin-antitoxin module